MRKRIAERLKDSQNTAAMLTTYNEVRDFKFEIPMYTNVCAISDRND